MYGLYSLSLNIEVFHFKKAAVYSKLSVLHAKLILSNFKPLRRKKMMKLPTYFTQCHRFPCTTNGWPWNWRWIRRMAYACLECSRTPWIILTKSAMQVHISWTENRQGNYKVPLTSSYLRWQTRLLRYDENLTYSYGTGTSENSRSYQHVKWCY